MPLSSEERRRRQAIDRDPANKCQYEGGCRNTARRDSPFCGAHIDMLEREASIQNEFASLHQRIYDLPDHSEEALNLRSILSDIVGLLEGTR